MSYTHFDLDRLSRTAVKAALEAQARIDAKKEEEADRRDLDPIRSNERRARDAVRLLARR